MRAGSAVVPVYPPMPFSHLVAPGNSRWRSAFPFSEPNGRWTFSGRVALHLGLPTLQLPPESTILVPCYFEGVEIQTLLANKFKLRFYRVDSRFTIDMNDVEDKMDGDVSALYVIHYIGFPQPLRTIASFCAERGLKLIEDCALSLFSRDKDGWLGNTGDLALYSIYKTLPIPHGGFLVTKNGRAAGDLQPAPFKSTVVQTKDLCHLYMRASGWNALEDLILNAARVGKRVLGWNKRDSISSGDSHWDPRLLEYGVSSWVYRLMRHADPDTVVGRRRRNYAHLLERLRDRVNTPAPFDRLPEGVCPLFYPVLVDDKIQFKRDLERLGVQSVNLWYQAHPACPPEAAGDATVWREHLLELPIHQGLSIADVDKVADSVIDVAKRQVV